MDIKIDFTSITGVQKLVRRLYSKVKEQELIIQQQDKIIKLYEQQNSKHVSGAPDKLTVSDSDGGFGSGVKYSSTERN